MSCTHRTSGNAALEKGLNLFCRILRDRGRTKLPLLMTDLSLPRSTLYRLAGVLEANGLIVRVAPGCYDIGLSLAKEMEAVSAQGQLARISRPLLRKLAHTCRATAHLGVMDNDMVTYLVKETSAAAGGAVAFTRENSQLEAYCSGIGKVLLAWQPEAEQARYLAGGPFVALTQRTITDANVMKACLERVKADEFACDDGEIAEDLYCLAVPVWNGKPPVTAAISLAFSRRQDQQRDDGVHLARLRACAGKLGLQLGQRPD